MGEMGFGGPKDPESGGRLLDHPEAWPARLAAMLPHMASFRPAFWAVCRGRDWRLNRADGPELQPVFEARARDAAAAIRGALAR